ncbi:MAG: RHS repeat-associated core domain-containing protein [Fibrobacter sp.]|nr:RHS repeat-associated core domain-containing protein [Fibrobacter sp.]
MAYDGSGRRVSKTRYSKACVSDEADGVYAADWERELVTHYTGIGTEVRENYRDGSLQNARVVVKSLQGERRKNKFTCFYDRAAAAYAEGVHMPQGLGRYGVEDAEKPSSGNATFEWYLKNHLGSTMLVYGTQSTSNADVADLGEVKKAYDYRSFGEQIDLIADAGDKVTENFTGIRLRGECCEHACMFIAEPMGLGAKRKEKDDETELNYFGARYLDPMLGLWISVDPARQHFSPYTYGSNNPVMRIDPDGNADLRFAVVYNKNQDGEALPPTLRSEIEDRLNQGLDPKYDTYQIKYFESGAEAADVNNFINGGTYGALAIHGEYDGDYYYLHDGAGTEFDPDNLKFNVKTLFGSCYSEQYLNDRSDKNLVAPNYLPTGQTRSFVESINFLINNSDTNRMNESGYDINFTGQ